tara:strand:+ start:1855 stop:2517 length:663 start_codon:yes stop_codon:yes gene_type:complete
LSDNLSIQILDYYTWEIPDSEIGQGLLLKTNRGSIKTIVHQSPQLQTDKAIIWVCGANGGFEGPANGMYRTISESLKNTIRSIRMDYREPNVLSECALDILSVITFLKSLGHSQIVLVGHSFGGAVVITAAEFSDLVIGVVALSSQGYGTSTVANISPRSLLLLHGGSDTRLPSEISEKIYLYAKEPKEIKIFPGNSHGLRESSDEITLFVKNWILNILE